MKKYRVYRSISFQEEVSKYDSTFQNRVDKIGDKLVENPKYGSLLGTEWFREARYENYRIYFLVYEDLDSIFMVGISDKKDQQKIINTIRLFLEFFREEIEKLVKQDKSQEENQ